MPITPSAANVREAIGDVRVLWRHRTGADPQRTDRLRVAVDAALLLKGQKALEKQRLIIKAWLAKTVWTARKKTSSISSACCSRRC